MLRRYMRLLGRKLSEKGRFLLSNSCPSRWQASATVRNSRKMSQGLCESQRRCPQICSSIHILLSWSDGRGGEGSSVDSGTDDLNYVVDRIAVSIETQESKRQLGRIDCLAITGTRLRCCGQKRTLERE